MSSPNQLQSEEESGYRKLRAASGVTLLALGIVGAVWIVERLLGLGTGPQDIPLLAKFVSFDATARTIVTPEGKYELPEGLYFAVGTLAYLITLGIVATLVKVLIASGAGLLGQEVTSATNRLRQEMERMRQHLEKKTL